VLLKHTERANAMLARLSSFLRYTLANEPTAKVTLARHVDTLKLYLEIEKTYVTPTCYPETVQRDDIHFHQSEEMAWKYLGTPERLASWARLMAQAQDAASTTVQKQRVAVFTKDIWSEMRAGRQKWEARQKP
jgi:hypothetical protein